jgi:hypothetical protein
MKLLFKYKTNFLVLAALTSLVLNLLIWLYTFWQYQISTDLIPLHYTIYFGIDLIDYKTKLFFYPLLGIIIISVNTILARLFRAEKLVGYFLILSAILAQIFILVTEVMLAVNYY